MYAAGMQVFYSSVRFPVSIWNGLYTQTNFPGIRDKYRNLWINPNAYALDTKHIIAPWGIHLRTLTSNVTDYKCALDSFGRSLHSYLNSPITGFWGIYNSVAGELTTVTPCILPDIWLYLTSKVVAKGMQAFVVPLERQTGLQNSAHKVAAYNAGLKSVPIPPARQALNIGTNEDIIRDDDEYFNFRLAFHAPANGGGGATLYTNDGNIVVGDNPLLGEIVTQRACVKDASMSATSTYLVARLATANTLWIPSINGLGQNLVMAVTNANGADTMTQVMAGRAFASLEVFLFPHKSIMPTTIIGGEKITHDDYLTESANSVQSLNSSSSSPASVPGAYSHLPIPAARFSNQEAAARGVVVAGPGVEANAAP